MGNQEGFIVFGAPDIGAEEIEEVVNCIESRWLGTGPRVHRFEGDFARFKGVPYANVCAVNSCTAALHLALIVAGIKPGDEVITTAMTFCATVNAIMHAGATPVLIDIDPVTLNIDVEKIEEKIGPRTKAIVPVHYAGLMCDMGYICALANKYNLKVIEDCAHAIEAETNGSKSGTIGDFGCFSFYSTKNITTGEGGMVVAKDPRDADRIRKLSLHGMSKDAWSRFGGDGYRHYQVVECGYKYNMMDIQASIGIHQLAKIGQKYNRRCCIWNSYQAAFANLPIGLPVDCRSGDLHSHHLYPIRIKSGCFRKSRDQMIGEIQSKGIGVGVHYLAIPEFPFYQQTLGVAVDDFPIARDFGRETISLPLTSGMSDQDLVRVVNGVTEVVLNASRGD